MSFRQYRNKIHCSIFTSVVILGIVIGVNACVSPNNDQKPEADKLPVPIFLFIQSSPDGKTIEGIVPSDLVEQFGSLDRVIQ